MPIANFQQLSTVVVYLFSDEFDLQALTLESIRGLGYSKVDNDSDRVQFADPDSRRAVRLQPRRIEFEFGDVNALSPEAIGTSVVKFLEKIGNKKMAALGTNYISKADIVGVQDAGVFIKNNFLKNEERLSGVLGKPILASSTRFFAGTPNDYYDIRLSLANLGEPTVIYNLHVHKNVSGVTDYDFQSDLLARLKQDRDSLQDMLNRVIA